jgi:hypothetical protein
MRAYSYESIERVMNGNFFGPDDLRRCGISISEKEFERTRIHWPKGFVPGDILDQISPLTGKKYSQSHFLWMGPAEFTLKSLNEFNFSGERKPIIFRYGENPFYENYPEMFLVPCRFAWYLSPLWVPDAFAEKKSEEQLRILPGNYFRLSAIEQTLKSFFYFIKTGIRLNEDITARCLDYLGNGNYANVGNFTLHGIGISSCPDIPSKIISSAASHRIAFFLTRRC